MAVVLVVEDEFLIRMNTIDMVENAGFETLEAGSADEALEILGRHPEIAIVFTDINMPGSLDGLDLAETVAQNWPSIRVVLTSGRYLLRDEALPNDDWFIPKPFDGEQLSNMLRGLVH
jgi:CheY-like chemotaxis protein